MKIVCPSCETSYQIDDRKVTGTGRVFRINCRSCKEAILVDGLDGQGAGLDGWYLNAAGDRHGPMDLSQLRARLSEDDVDSSALIWSNGMDSWRPASELGDIVAPWEAETIQSDEDEEEGATTLISLDEIARVHAELEERDAPLLGDDEVEMVGDELPPELPPFEPPDAIAETVQRPSSEELGSHDLADGGLPPFEPPDAVAETVQRPSSDERSPDAQDDGDVAQTLVFELDPSTLGANPNLPEASEVIPSSETGEDLHEVGNSAASLFRLDDLELGNESKSGTSPGHGGVGLTSSSLFVGDTVNPTDPATVRARPRPAGTVTTNVPIVKKKQTWIWAGLFGLVAFGIGYLIAVSDDTPDPPPLAQSAESKQVESPPAVKAVDTPAEPEKSSVTVEEPVKTQEVAPKKEPEVAAPAGAKEPAPASEVTSSTKERTERKPRRSAASAAAAAETRARARAARRALREEPVPDFGRAGRQPKRDRSARSKRKAKPAEESNSVNALLGQLKNKPGKSSAAEQEQIPQKLSASEVRGTLRKRQGRFKGCYRKMVNRPEGVVTVKTSFKIISSGRVASARIVSAAGVDGTVQNCILEAVKGALFPRFRNAEMIVNYPILLR